MMRFNLYFLSTIMVVTFFKNVQSQIPKSAKETIDIQDLYIRDPYVLPDTSTNTYFLYKAAMVDNGHGKQQSGVAAYESEDLKTWKGPYIVYQTPSDNWITGGVWAPEVHRYKGRYYLFATLNSDIPWKKQKNEWPAYTFRGTQIFYSDSPLGPFKPFSRFPHTPMDEMALDGTLWIEDGKPFMVYCHEWVQEVDGAMNVIQLKPDLSGTIGSPVRLFYASAAAWSTGSEHSDGQVSYVTDGCFLYKTKSGNLLMIWSSFYNGRYAIGVSQSVTGSVMGPWVHQSKPLFEQHGGHGMLFRTFDGRLVLTFHGPNSPAGKERAIFYEVEDQGDTLTLGNRIGM